MDSKLRLNIVTALDNAGIKATKEEIDGLEKELKKVNQSGQEGFGGLDKSLTGLPGKLGKVTGGLGTLGKAFGTVGAAMAVFKEGFEIGKGIREWLGERIEWLQTEEQAAKKLAEEDEERQRGLQQEIELMQMVSNRKMELWSKEQNAIDKTVSKIDEQTKAYFRQVEALKGMQSARNNAEALKLERMKFEDMTAYQAAGYGEAAEQLGKAYDVALEELKVKQQLRDFDQETAKLEKGKVADEEKFLKVMQGVEKSEAALAREREKLQKVGRTTRGEKYKIQEQSVEKAQARYDRQFQRALELSTKLYENEADDQKRAIERSNIESAGSLAVDRAAWAYDNYAEQNGNPLNVSIDENWSNELLEQSFKSWETQQGILQATSGLSAMLEQLLQLKQ